MTSPLNPEPSNHARHDDTEVSAAEICADRLGEGVPVVFLHGLLGLKEHFAAAAAELTDKADCWLVQAPLLSLRGSQCSVVGATELVAAFLAERINEPAVLVGNSLGGHLALRIALDHPERVKGLVLAGSSGLFERTFEKDVQHRPTREWIDRKITDLFYDKDRMPDGVVDRAYEELSQRKAARSLVRLSRTAKADHMGSRLPRVEQPTLLLWGRQDNVTPPSVAEEFHSLLPNSELRWIEKCGHAPMIEQPVAFAEGVRAFLERLELEAAKAEARQEVA